MTPVEHLACVRVATLTETVGKRRGSISQTSDIADTTGTPPDTSLPLLKGIVPYSSLRGNASFARLVCFHALVMPADWLYAVTVFAMAYDQSHSPTVVGVLTLARLLSPAVSALFAGALSEKWDQKGILLTLNLGRAACVPGLLFVHGHVFIPVAFLMMLIMGIMAGLRAFLLLDLRHMDWRSWTRTPPLPTPLRNFPLSGSSSSRTR